MTRANVRAKRQRVFHETRIDEAATPKQKLWRACSWLVAEAWRRNRIDNATETVLTAVHELREGGDPA